MTKAKKVKTMKKPTKKQAKPYWDFYEVMGYLEQLHGKNFRDYAGKHGSNKDNVPYLDFWHWVCDQNEVHNGSWIHLPDWHYYMDPDTHTDEWKKEIMQYFYDFLGDDYHERLWAAW